MLHLRGTIVMAPHARSWGAIDPALRPPLSSVPGRTMAGAFYLRFFPNNLSHHHPGPQDHLCCPKCATLHPRPANQEDSEGLSYQLYSEKFPLLPVMHLSVTSKYTNRNHIFSHVGHLPNKSHQTHFVVVGQDELAR